MDKNKCSSCGKPKCSCKNKDFTKRVIEIDNPEQITLMRKVVIPASMGDDTTVPPVVGKYKNVLLFYEANSKSYLYSSDGIPTQLVNGVTDYEQAVNLPQINGVTLLGDKSSADLKLADAPVVVHVTNNNIWSSDKTSQEIYELFNSGVNVVVEFDERPSDEKTWPVLQLGYDENNGTLIGIIAIGYTELEETTWNSSFVKIDFRANRTVASTEIRLQEKLTAGDGIEIEDNTISISEIEQYAHFFDTVADMKGSVDLVDGNFARTYGYYEKSDIGGSYYKISSTAPSGYYETLNSGLYAELILESVMNVKQFGAKGDGDNDDTGAIQTALNSVSNVTIPDGTYMVNAETNITLNSGNRLMLNENAKIKAITTSATGYKIINITDVNNVEVCGGTIEGDRDTHTGTTGEYGHCINIMGDCDNIYIHDINVTKAWGDGIYFHSTGTVYTSRVHVDNPRRNGYSVITAGKLISNNDIIENVGGATGTAPKDGIDIEPNLDTESVYVVFNNLITKNNSSVGLALNHDRDNQIPMYIEANNYHSEGDNRGISLAYGANAKGTVILNDAYIKDSRTGAGAINIQSTGKNYHILLNRPVVRGYSVNSVLQAGIMISGHSDADSGNIKVINPIVIEPSPDEGVNNVAAIRFGAISNGVYNNVGVIDPIDLGGKAMTFNGEYTNSTMSDRYNQAKYDEDSNLQIAAGTYYSLVSSANYTSNRTVTIKNSSTIPAGATITFENTGNYTMSIIFEDQYIYPLSSSTGSTLTIADKGGSLTIRRISSTEWIVEKSAGIINVS